ncbi:MAG: type I DNA topoisomerase [Pelagibacterales bacterium]|nr:type I DNA topoisomerase [Pelagibacterales bacterium]
MNLVIVESPAKAKTINKYLGNDYNVLASFGHVRDLPSKNGSVDPENDFSFEWEVSNTSKKHIKEIYDAAESSSNIFLATDPDREGEAIAWHIIELLNKKKLTKDKSIKRVVFSEITKSAVKNGIDNPRELDHSLVDAYLARRALDYLFGFSLSPVLWRKLPGAKSAGRVQSVALRLICEREVEIESFDPQEYWKIKANLEVVDNSIEANLTHHNGEKVDKFSFKNEEDAIKVTDSFKGQNFKFTDITKKPASRNPDAPFSTSTLQQTASSIFGFGASRTMQIAQRLFQGVEIDGETTGLITYMRTDSTDLSKEAIHSYRDFIQNNFDSSYLPKEIRSFKSKKAKNAQEAHEGIRPTDILRKPEEMKKYLDEDGFKLYNLIWKRSLASQMSSASFERTAISISSENETIKLRANGSIQTFDGFLNIYSEFNKKSEIIESEENEDDKDLPNITLNDNINNVEPASSQHFTLPPPRYSEATLVKKLEELGIGRPSTYASIISVLKMRNYVEVEKNRFVPEDRAILITGFLKGFFSKYVDYEFTAEMEESLDEITSGTINWKEFLDKFWKNFSSNIGEVTDLRITNVLDHLNESLKNHIFVEAEGKDITRECPTCSGQLSLKVSRFGAFVGCSKYPECKFTRPISPKKIKEVVEDKVLGIDEETKKEIKLLSGRFGPYIQLGDNDTKDKPKRSSVPKGIPATEIDLAKANYLLSLPREIGLHPESSEMITINYGRYGGYLSCAEKNASLEDISEFFEIGINRAVSLLANAKPGRLKSSSEIKTLGDHPDDKKPVKVMKGKFGPYIKYKTINATIPDQYDPETISMDEALDLIERKLEKDGKSKKKKVKKKAIKKKTVKDTDS